MYTLQLKQRRSHHMRSHYEQCQMSICILYNYNAVIITHNNSNLQDF